MEKYNSETKCPHPSYPNIFNDRELADELSQLVKYVGQLFLQEPTKKGVDFLKSGLSRSSDAEEIDSLLKTLQYACENEDWESLQSVIQKTSLRHMLDVLIYTSGFMYQGDFAGKKQLSKTYKQVLAVKENERCHPKKI